MIDISNLNQDTKINNLLLLTFRLYLNIQKYVFNIILINAMGMY